MEALIDQVLNIIMRSAIWRTAWHLPPATLVFIAVVVFIIIAIRRKRRGKRSYRSRRKWF